MSFYKARHYATTTAPSAAYLDRPPRLDPKLTAKETHQHILFQRRWKKYFTMTTMATPWAPWHPLLMHPQMETRPCQYGNSRIHKLTCGHTIAVPRDAEPCAANCAKNAAVESPYLANSVPAQHLATLEKIRKSVVDGVNAYGGSFRATDAQLDAKFKTHVDVIQQVWLWQERRIRPVPDLIRGDFACDKCKDKGHRAAFPTFALSEDPYFCIVVGRDERDLVVMEELEKGMLQELRVYQFEKWQRERRYRSLSPQFGRHVRDGRVRKMRESWEERHARYRETRRDDEWNTRYRETCRGDEWNPRYRETRRGEERYARYRETRRDEEWDRYRERRRAEDRRNARLTRRRVEEKKRVVERLRDEALWEGMGVLGFDK